MTLKIGRFGSDIAVNNSGSAAWDGDSLVLSGIFFASSLEDAAALRDQLEGHANNPDEPFVPVNLDSIDPRLSGFYTVEDVKVDTTKVSLAQTGVSKFAYQYSATLRPVTQSAAPLFESMLTPIAKLNAITYPYEYVGLPVGSFAPVLYNLDLAGNVAGISSTSVTRASADGPVLVIDGTTAAGFGTNYNWSIVFGSSFSNYYLGSCSITAGANLRAVAGQQPPKASQWRIQNGLVRVTYAASSSDIDVSHWDGSAWDTKRYRFFADGTQLPAWQQWQILRNSPECVTIRLFSGAANTGAARNVDLTLRRGSLIVEGVFTRFDTVASGSISIQVGLATTETSTTMTWSTGGPYTIGVKASGNDGNGNRYLLFTTTKHATSTPALTTDTVNCRIGVTQNISLDPLGFAISASVNHTTVAAPNREIDLVPQYTAEGAESVSVVA